jgi:hypothetical protein
MGLLVRIRASVFFHLLFAYYRVDEPSQPLFMGNILYIIDNKSTSQKGFSKVRILRDKSTCLSDMTSRDVVAPPHSRL